ncbi:hypothetical protein ACHAXT_012372 [Thalassiosira profunda]
MGGMASSIPPDEMDAILMPPPPPRRPANPPPPKRQRTRGVTPPPPRPAALESHEGPPDSISVAAPPPPAGHTAASSDAPGLETEVRVAATGSEAKEAVDAAAERSLALNDEGSRDPLNEVSTDDSSRQPRADAKKPPSPESVVRFRDIIGHSQAKLRLDEALLPLALPADLASTVLAGIRAAPASILLHGPPGCGKTQLAKAVAGEAGAAFLCVGPSDVLSKFVGESEQSIRGLFREARKKARKMESRCCVVFFDEVDALGRSRVDEEGGKASQAGGDSSSRRVLAELLIQLTSLSNDNGEGGSDEEEGEEEDYRGYGDDGDSLHSGRSTISTGPGMFDRTDGGMMERRPGSSGSRPMSPPMLASLRGEERTVDRTPTRSGAEGNNNSQPKPRVIVVAATNRPEDCDAALLRRFSVRVLVGLPSRKDRKKIVRRLLSDVEHNVTSSQLDMLARETEGWSGSDLESMTREAAMAPVRECLRAVAVLKKKAGRAAADGMATNATRETLLNRFRNLRPVSCKDFEEGIRFFLGDQQGSGGGFSSGWSPVGKHAHYDSSSEDEDE